MVNPFKICQKQESKYQIIQTTDNKENNVHTNTCRNYKDTLHNNKIENSLITSEINNVPKANSTDSNKVNKMTDTDHLDTVRQDIIKNQTQDRILIQSLNKSNIYHHVQDTRCQKVDNSKQYEDTNQ